MVWQMGGRERRRELKAKGQRGWIYGHSMKLHNDGHVHLLLNLFFFLQFVPLIAQRVEHLGFTIQTLQTERHTRALDVMTQTNV